MSVDLEKGATVELVKTLSDDMRTASDGSKYGSAGDAVRAKANKVGNYPNIKAGTIEQLISDNYTEESKPYLFRKSESIGDRAEDLIIGGTVAWNQMVNTGSTSVTVQSGHKYLPKVNNVQTIGASTGSAISINDASADNVFDLTQMFGSTVADAIYAKEQASAGAGVAWFRSLFPKPYYEYNAGTLMHVGGLVSHDTVGKNLFDEVAFFTGASGWTSSDGQYTGSIEDITEVSYKPLLPEIPYDGQITFTCDYINANSNRAGYVVFEYIDGTKTHNEISANKSSWTHLVCTSSANKRVSKVYVLRSNIVTISLKEVQIEFGSTATAYEPYHKHSYALDSSLTLRGVPKLDSNNRMYFDADEYASDGSVKRKYGIVDLGTLNWIYNTTRARHESGAIPTLKPQTGSGLICPNYVTSPSPIGNQSEDKTISGYSGNNYLYVVDSSYTDAATFKTAMSGVYLVYELATPTAETAQAYTNPQIVSKYGTEEYVCETEADVIVPVGHSTKYHADLKGKIEGLPKDFSTLIAPTEAEYKATQNYTVNDLVIVNNILYKVTANIANGGTITPNTNVTQTTLSALIKALSA